MESRYEDVENKIVCEIWRWPSVINSLVRGFNKLGYAPPTSAHIGFKGGGGERTFEIEEKNKKYKLARPSTTTNQETKKPATPPFQVTLYNIPDVADIHLSMPLLL